MTAEALSWALPARCAARTRLIMRENGLAGQANCFIVPASYIERDGQRKAKDPVNPA